MSTAFDFCKKNEKIPFSEEKGEDVDKLNLHFFKNAEGLGEQRVPQMESAVGIHFRRGKAGVSKAFKPMELLLYTSAYSSKA